MNNFINGNKLKQKLFLPRWSVLIASILVSVVASSFIYQINQWAELRSATKVLLLNMKGQISRLNSLEWEAIAKQQLDDKLFSI